ncbi:hypothetical protein AB1Y20_005790 [Prymnesium parvum]|uniref:F-box domain-containing protein n=1 Tax=Prymnesium parvum TaxID=97485 RepID=A0AB34J0T2_PRYPA
MCAGGTGSSNEWGLLLLPAEVLAIICGNLRSRLSAETASSIAVLAGTCREMHAFFAEDLRQLRRLVMQVRGASLGGRPPRGISLASFLKNRQAVQQQQALIRQELLGDHRPKGRIYR